VPGAENIVDSAALCRSSCAAEPRCSAWVWCWREGGCDDGHEWDPRGRPFRSCTLYALPAGRPLAERDRGPQFSSFSQGFMPGAQSSSSGPGLQQQMRSYVAWSGILAMTGCAAASVADSTLSHTVFVSCHRSSLTCKYMYACRHGCVGSTEQHKLQPTSRRRSC